MSPQSAHLRVVPDPESAPEPPFDCRRVADLLGIDTTSAAGFAAALPFAGRDATLGSENELQTAVLGSGQTVDLPLMIAQSNYYRNLQRRALTGDAPQRSVSELAAHLADNPDGVWENSWVRFPLERLGSYARSVLERDLQADKGCPGTRRSDCERFFLRQDGATWLRVPVSYLLKLSLAEAIGDADPSSLVRASGERCLRHFLSDNTSPETFSFYPVAGDGQTSPGTAIAGETLRRFLLGQFLAAFANQQFGLAQSGQEVTVYFAPNPPLRQKRLNRLISDGFYRDLFMSPCLSGWDCGEKKHRYMVLCHQVLSRSQLNAVAKLKEAGVITRNLIVLPDVSNTSLANNGTHVSIGSRKLSALLQAGAPDFGPAAEKHLGDLVIKIVEHFLPLFVGTYSAAPYRLDFQDFHPEKVLGFLPHELDFTHLRMLWRRWKKKASLSCCGRSLTPFGPEWLDQRIPRFLGLRGDMVDDFRLLDYPAALLSTASSPALDGRLGNELRLKEDLAAMGVFDPAMSIYLAYRLRQFAAMGYSGFEGRHFSMFHRIMEDMGPAADLQVLLTALAFGYVLRNEVGHDQIPDDPFVESERRQIFFGAAVGIPTFYVRQDTRNRFLARILGTVQDTRLSRRYRGYVRVQRQAYCQALVETIRRDGRELIEQMALGDVIEDLAARLAAPERGAARRLTAGILETAGAEHPLQLSGAEFNTAAERYYRGALKNQAIRDAFGLLEEDFKAIDAFSTWREGTFNKDLYTLLGGRSAPDFLGGVKRDLLTARADPDTLRTTIQVMLLTLERDRRRQAAITGACTQ
ncbi:MAG: hypothetical protein PVI39_00335 [Desulfobacteraceae bacterium]|jgi:hypothetical protein